MKRLSLVLFMLCSGCATTHWQAKANEFHSNIAAAAATAPMRDDFMRKYGPPDSCVDLKNGGSLCQWRSSIGRRGIIYALGNPYNNPGNMAVTNSRSISKALTIEFDHNGKYVRSKVVIQRGEREYTAQ